MEYLQLVAEYRLQDSVKQEIASFSKGLQYFVDDELISIFDENELEVQYVDKDVLLKAMLSIKTDLY